MSGGLARQGATGRLVLALGVFVVWVGITLGLGRLLAPDATDLLETVRHGIGWPFAAAVVFLLAIVGWAGWRDVGLNRWPREGSWRLMAFPSLYVLGFVGLAAVLGLPAPSVMFFIFLNTFLVGISEELMFRGVLLSAFRRRFAVWPAILASCAIFGAVHSLNVILTGNLEQALAQSAAAFLSGFLFVALRLRAGSLWPPIVMHALWDFGTFLLVAATGNVTSGAVGDPPATGTALLFPVLFVLPNALYALWLLRHIPRDAKV